MEYKEWKEPDLEPKHGWGEGPWQNEPDKIQWEDKATGLPCLIKRNTLGALCGYVGVTADHPCYEKHYDDKVCLKIDTHGGLTYANHCQEGNEAKTICHVPGEGEPDDVWWLGFDCAHVGDLVPSCRSLRKKYADIPDNFEETYKDVQYVTKECTELARQLKEMGESETTSNTA